MTAKLGSAVRSRARRAVNVTGLPKPPSLAAVFRALGDETRLEILARLANSGESLCVCDIECCFDLSQPTVSHHLKVLREAGLVTCERRGTWVHCAVDADSIERIAAFARELVSPPARRPTRKGKSL